MESMNPYQAPAADVSAIPGQAGFDTSGAFSPKGRFGRLSYIAWGLLFGFGGTLLLMLLGGSMTAIEPGAIMAMGPLAMIFQIVLLAVMILFAIRRLHDFNASGWWSLLFLIPIANMIFALVLILKGGNAAANRFAPPRVTRGWEKVLGYIGIGFMVLSVIGIFAAVLIPALVPLTAQ